MSWTPDGRALLPRVAVLATGGTIAGAHEPGSDVSYRAGSISVEDLLAAVPGAADIARLQAEQLAAVGSQDMTTDIWLTLAARISRIAERNEADAVVVTHGTDTLEETAWFLALTLAVPLPVVLVGAMRPAAAPSADGPANLRNAIVLAASGRTAASGPVVVMNEQIHGARDVQKIAASGLCAFASPNRGPLGVLAGDSVMLHARPDGDALAGRFACCIGAAVQSLPRVDIVYAHVGQDPALVDWLAGQGARGLVLAGVGGGNASQPVLAALARAAHDGVIVVRASRTGSGLVAPGAEVDDAALGLVAAFDLSPQKARILLMLALACGHDAAYVQRCFSQR